MDVEPRTKFTVASQGPPLVRLCVALLLALPNAAGFAQEVSPFDERVPFVSPSPVSSLEHAVPSGDVVVDLDPSPSGGEVAAILAPRAGGPGRIVFVSPGEPPIEAWKAPAGMTMKSVTWHPEASQLFVIASLQDEWQILRLLPGSPSWFSTVVHRSDIAMRRLVVGPRPFVVGNEPGSDGLWKKRYRLFFGLGVTPGRWAIHTTTEDGEQMYQVLGPEESMTALNERDDGPGGMIAISALPLGFHPAGHILLWQDDQERFHRATYGEREWRETEPLWDDALKGGSVTALPNGLGVLHWKPGAPGVRAVTQGGEESIRLADEWTFVSSPSPMPDGKGIVGVTRTGNAGSDTIHFIPVTMPLGDVSNAWMFVEGSDDAALLERHAGLFRRLGGEQLYQLYDSELYNCGGYSETIATRPYLVTTDALWEVWAAAFEGLFILREREEAIPAYWEFVEAAAAELDDSAPGSRQAKLFNAVLASRGEAAGDAEAMAIRSHSGTTSFVLGDRFDFGDLEPRGHYTATGEMRRYFSAMRYLTAAEAIADDASILATLSQVTKQKAVRWIEAYEPFIAPSKSPELLRAVAAPRGWISHRGEKPVVFPLSWGFDNEVLDSTVYHSDWPEAEQIISESGRGRLVPSGLDVAAAFGSEVARRLLADEIETYPPLKRALDRLIARRPAKEEGLSLYERWLEVLGTQWLDETLAMAPAESREVWGVKRLQTGLASWATLRHATVLVNERSAAECGEGGFEELIRRPPRGWVETDPKTFEAIASLFDAAARLVESSRGKFQGNLPEDASNDGAAKESLRQGLLKRLRESAAKTRNFGRMAALELKGEALTPADYEAILYFGRAAEHDFLVFKSLASRELALSNPEPMTKVADVAGGGVVPLLLAAVGAPLELDLVVPFAGRRQVVKGSVYAYHELTAKLPMNDEAWREREPTTRLAPWVEPFVAETKLTCPPHDPY